MGLDKLLNRGPSAAELKSRQEEAARKERDRIQMEEAQQAASQRQEEQKAYTRAQASMQQPSVKDDETMRRKFLKGI